MGYQARRETVGKHKEQNDQDRTLIININLTQGWLAWSITAILIVVFLGSLMLAGQETVAADGQAVSSATTGMRRYYLSKVGRDGANAESACAEGYHMASLWEILDPSNLMYNTELGGTRDDSGAGPITFWGWVRTGYVSNSDNVAGRANCDAWTTSDPTAYGTLVNLPNGSWDPNYADLHVWSTFFASCDETNAVWCVED
jgi:hypothetical protein